MIDVNKADNLGGGNRLMLLEGATSKNVNLDSYLRNQIKQRRLKVSKKQYATMLKKIAKGYEQHTLQQNKTMLKGYLDDNNILLGGDEIEELNGIDDHVELLGYVTAIQKPTKVLPLLAKPYNDFSRSELRKILVEDTGVLLGDEFDGMSDEMLGSFFKKLFKGIGKGIKGIGKFVGKVGKGIAKGVGKVVKGVGKGIFNVVKGVGKFIGKNWKNLITLPLALIPGGSILVDLAQSVLSQHEEQQPEQQQQQYMQQDNISPDLAIDNDMRTSNFSEVTETPDYYSSDEVTDDDSQDYPVNDFDTDTDSESDELIEGMATIYSHSGSGGGGGHYVPHKQFAGNFIRDAIKKAHGKNVNGNFIRDAIERTQRRKINVPKRLIRNYAYNFLHDPRRRNIVNDSLRLALHGEMFLSGNDELLGGLNLSAIMKKVGKFSTSLFQKAKDYLLNNPGTLTALLGMKPEQQYLFANKMLIDIQSGIKKTALDNINSATYKSEIVKQTAELTGSEFLSQYGVWLAVGLMGFFMISNSQSKK